MTNSNQGFLPMGLLKFLLYPFSQVYGVITRIRNSLYDRGLLKSTSFALPIIGVGNLRVGGTGKTPMVEYLIELLSPERKVATLSRGYGRKSVGFRMADPEDNAQTIGDEPYQIFLKFRQKVAVAVGEDRVGAIPEIISRLPDVEILLLDDIFQHRALQSAERAVSLDSKDPLAHFALGRVHTLQGEFESAIAELEKSLELNPSNARAHFGLGMALHWSGRASESLPRFETAIRLSPHDPLMWAFENMVGSAHIHLDDYEQAANWCRKRLNWKLDFMTQRR